MSRRNCNRRSTLTPVLPLVIVFPQITRGYVKRKSTWDNVAFDINIIMQNLFQYYIVILNPDLFCKSKGCHKRNT